LAHQSVKHFAGKQERSKKNIFECVNRIFLLSLRNVKRQYNETIE